MLQTVLSRSERKIPYNITYIWNLKYDTNETYLQDRNRITDTENSHGCQGWGWTDWEFIKQIQIVIKGMDQ